MVPKPGHGFQRCAGQAAHGAHKTPGSLTPAPPTELGVSSLPITTPGKRGLTAVTAKQGGTGKSPHV